MKFIANLSLAFTFFFSLNLDCIAQKVSFTDKKISDLNLGTSLGHIGGMEELAPTFPKIWLDYFPENDEYIFSGFYSISPESTEDNVVLNGPVSLTRVNVGAAEGTLNIKEELQFNIKNGIMEGPVKYTIYYCDYLGENEDTELKNRKWDLQNMITATFSGNDFLYRNIKYVAYGMEKNIAYTITQTESYDISLYYFSTITELNTLPLAKRPVFKKVPYVKK